MLVLILPTLVLAWSCALDKKNSVASSDLAETSSRPLGYAWYAETTFPKPLFAVAHDGIRYEVLNSGLKNKHEIRAIDLEGNSIWSFSKDDSRFSDKPLCPLDDYHNPSFAGPMSGLLFFSSRCPQNLPGPGTVYAIDSLTGQVKWKAALKNADARPEIASNVVIFGTRSSTPTALEAFDAATGLPLYTIAVTDKNWRDQYIDWTGSYVVLTPAGRRQRFFDIKTGTSVNTPTIGSEYPVPRNGGSAEKYCTGREGRAFGIEFRNDSKTQKTIIHPNVGANTWNVPDTGYYDYTHSCFVMGNGQRITLSIEDNAPSKYVAFLGLDTSSGKSEQIYLRSGDIFNSSKNNINIYKEACIELQKFTNGDATSIGGGGVDYFDGKFIAGDCLFRKVSDFKNVLLPGEFVGKFWLAGKGRLGKISFSESGSTHIEIDGLTFDAVSAPTGITSKFAGTFDLTYEGQDPTIKAMFPVLCRWSDIKQRQYLQLLCFKDHRVDREMHKWARCGEDPLCNPKPEGIYLSRSNLGPKYAYLKALASGIYTERFWQWCGSEVTVDLSQGQIKIRSVGVGPNAQSCPSTSNEASKYTCEPYENKCYSDSGWSLNACKEGGYQLDGSGVGGRLVPGLHQRGNDPPCTTVY